MAGNASETHAEKSEFLFAIHSGSERLLVVQY